MIHSPSTVFALICMIFAFETIIIQCQPFYEEDNEVMSVPFEERKASVFYQAENCVKQGDVCDHRLKDCCSGSTCRCNLWGYNCICQPNEDMSMPFEDEKVNMRDPADKRASNIYVHRRSCVRRGGACDHRPNDCCFSSSCRCNLWGSNCRCQRMGLFQKWG